MITSFSQSLRLGLTTLCFSLPLFANTALARMAEMVTPFEANESGTNLSNAPAVESYGRNDNRVVISTTSATNENAVPSEPSNRDHRGSSPQIHGGHPMEGHEGH